MSKISLKEDLNGCAIRTFDNPYLYEFVNPSNGSVLVAELTK